MKKSKLLWIMGLVIIVINLYVYIFKPGGDVVLKYFSDILPVICSFITVLGLSAALKSFKVFDQAKLSWFLLLIGIVLFFLGETIYGVLELVFKVDVANVFPTYADWIGWIPGYIPMIIGLWLLVNGYKKSGFSFGNPRTYVLASIFFILLAVAIITTILIPIAHDSETSTIAKYVYFYYPIFDIFIIVPAVILAYITNLFGKAKISLPWRYIALGFICMTIADILYSYLQWSSQYGSGNYTDLAWHAGYLFIALGGLYQKELIDSV